MRSPGSPTGQWSPLFERGNLKQCGAIEEVKWHRSSRINSSNENGTISPNGEHFLPKMRVSYGNPASVEKSTWNIQVLDDGDSIKKHEQ